MSVLLDFDFDQQRRIISEMDIPGAQKEALLLYTLHLESQIALIRQLNQIEGALLVGVGLIREPANPFSKGETL